MESELPPSPSPSPAPSVSDQNALEELMANMSVTSLQLSSVRCRCLAVSKSHRRCLISGRFPGRLVNVGSTGVVWYRASAQFTRWAAVVRCSAPAMARALFPWGIFRKPLYIQVSCWEIPLRWGSVGLRSQHLLCVSSGREETRPLWTVTDLSFDLHTPRTRRWSLKVFTVGFTWCSAARQESTILLIPVAVATTSIMHPAATVTQRREAVLTAVKL